MKENTKYNDYRFVGKYNIEEIQPWFDFTSNKPWDEGEIPWVVENKVRREILIKLSDGPKSFREICNSINFSPKPLLIKKQEYDCKINYQWADKTIENHLLNMEWNNLIKKNNDKYEITFPVFKLENSNDMENYTSKIAENWVKIIQESKTEMEKCLKNVEKDPNNLAILIEKIVEKLYETLKKEKILRTEEPNLKLLWAEQLRKSKFENWLEKNF